MWIPKRNKIYYIIRNSYDGTYEIWNRKPCAYWDGCYWNFYDPISPKKKGLFSASKFHLVEYEIEHNQMRKYFTFEETIAIPLPSWKNGKTPEDMSIGILKNNRIYGYKGKPIERVDCKSPGDLGAL